MDALDVARLRSNSQTQLDAWRGEVTSAVTAALRERIFALLSAADGTSVRLDVRAVTAIDAAGVAVLVGARHRAAAVGRTLVLVDSDGPVTRALRQMHLLPLFLVTQVVSADGRELASQG